MTALRVLTGSLLLYCCCLLCFCSIPSPFVVPPRSFLGTLICHLIHLLFASVCSLITRPRPPNLKPLQVVDLSGCFYIRDDSIRLLLERCPLVERLGLRNCRKLTDISLGHIVRYGRNITALDIGGCFNLTGPGVDAVSSTHPNASR